MCSLHNHSESNRSPVIAPLQICKQLIDALRWRIDLSLSDQIIHFTISHNVSILSLTNPSFSLHSGIPGDGRCLFRSVVHGAHLREGKPAPSESHERELADELRAKVADEFIKRRADSEWFVEGDFDAYVTQMRRPHVWGGEPELLMSSHVLQVPITVHMLDKRSNCLKIIAEYGQEYGKGNPIRVLYHGYGHYDALQSPLVVQSQNRTRKGGRN
ncbi:Hypothetical predicted protein [Olea europaea subsp. europaea]|uniref:Ubiquitin thioesterase OTU n=1 Tax=Olea europaea subsp. europaea TaxID=158383 RepID=A0A8S0QVN1_OLEEU|nr:Hypothetical predicted protein [Olea europaea subsp. europaea]